MIVCVVLTAAILTKNSSIFHAAAALFTGSMVFSAMFGFPGEKNPFFSGDKLK